MNNVINQLKAVRIFLILFVATLLFSFSTYFIYFTNSTYLESHVGTQNVGYIYAIGAILNILIYILIPKFLRRFGNFKLILWITSITALLLLALATVKTTPSVLTVFIIFQGVSPVIAYCIDIFLEKFSPPGAMGSIRGIYLTMVTIPAIVAPSIAGLILSQPDYWKLYLIAAIFLVPFIIIMVSYFRKFEDPYYPKLHAVEVAKKFYHNHNIFDIFLDNFLLNLFYCWMTIYMPLYLRNIVGLEWSEIGLIFSIMLLPFLLLQIPVGKIADKHRDEKYLLMFGFFIIAGTTLLIPFIEGKSIVMWATILFTSRVGASIVEVASESFFFKHVHASNTGYISLFRLTRSLPFLVTPLVGILIPYIELKFTFIILGLIMLLGIRYAIKIKPDGLPGHEKESISPFA